MTLELTIQELKLLKQQFTKYAAGGRLYLHRNRDTGVLTICAFQMPLSVCFIEESDVDTLLSEENTQPL